MADGRPVADAAAARRTRSRGACSRRPSCAACACRTRRFAALKTFLAIHVPLDRAAEALAAFAAGRRPVARRARSTMFAARAEAIEPPWPAGRRDPLRRRLRPAARLLHRPGLRDRRRRRRRGRWPAAAATTGCSRCSARRSRSPASASRSGSTASSNCGEAARDAHAGAAVERPAAGSRRSELFGRAGLAVEPAGDERKYRARIDGRADIEVSFLSASEIASEIGAGSVDLGITGEDLLRENAGRLGGARRDRGAPRLRPCRCRGRGAGCLARCRHHGRSRRRRRRFPPAPRPAAADRHQILAAHPAVLLAEARHPGLPHRRKPRRHRRRAGGGLADVIVDITTTGSTLRANHLKVLADGVILRSQACLVASRKRARSGGHAAVIARVGERGWARASP